MTPNNPVVNLVAAGATGNQVVRLDSKAKGVLCLINMISGTGTLPTLTVAIQGITPDAAATKYTILASTALAGGTPGVTQLVIYPGSPVSANATSDLAVPQDLNINTTIGGSASPTITATISIIGLL